MSGDLQAHFKYNMRNKLKPNFLFVSLSSPMHVFSKYELGLVSRPIS